jgi:predicted Zn-dependent peptidase
LAGGVTVVTAALPGFASAAVTVTVRAGSRDEGSRNSGVAHLLEHMAFKGTATRSSFDISAAIEMLGASINAFTGQEQTTYYVTGLRHTVPDAVEILGDVLTSSRFAPADLDTERGVIAQEIARSRDDPRGLAYEGFSRAAYPGQSIGRPVLGDAEFIASATRDDLLDFVETNYCARNTVVAAAGAVEHAAFVDLVNEWLAAIPDNPPPPRSGASYVGGYHVETRADFKQINVVLGLPSVPLDHPDRMAHQMLGAALGGGMSSPLFQEVREKRGLVYAVGASSSHGSDLGQFLVTGGMTPPNLEEFLRVASAELARVGDHIEPRDVQRARNGMLAQYATVRERPFNLALYLAQQVLRSGQAVGPAPDIAAIEAVTLEDVLRVARALIAQPPTLSLVGPVPEVDHLVLVREALAGG